VSRVVSAKLATAGWTDSAGHYRQLDVSTQLSSKTEMGIGLFQKIFWPRHKNQSSRRHNVTSIQGCTTFTYTSQSPRRQTYPSKRRQVRKGRGGIPPDKIRRKKSKAQGGLPLTQYYSRVPRGLRPSVPAAASRLSVGTQ